MPEAPGEAREPFEVLRSGMLLSGLDRGLGKQSQLLRLRA
jgi:hypothetical protein